MTHVIERGMLSRLLERLAIEDLMLIIPMDLINEATLGGKIDAVEELARFLIDKLAERKQLEKKRGAGVVRTDGAVPDSVISAFILAMLDLCARRRCPPPQALIDLVSDALNASGQPARQPRRPEAKSAAVKYVMMNPKAGIREVARTVGVHPSVAKRWMDDEKFQRDVETNRLLQDFIDDMARNRSKRSSPRCSPR